MMNADDHGKGEVEFDGDRAMVEFERLLDATIDAVWAMISTADGLEQWLAPANVDLTTAGSVDIDFGDDGMVGGTIIELAPNTLLEFIWRFQGEPDSVLRFELEDLGPRTRLRLRHRLLPRDQSAGYGAGWHAHLDRLDALLTGRDPGIWMDRFNALLLRYG